MPRDSRDSGYHQREENPHQGASHDFGKSVGGEHDRGDRAAGDRQRNIETGREHARQTPSVGRPHTISPRFGVAASPFSLVRRMADDMDRLFQDFGFGRSGIGLFPSLGSVVDRVPGRGGSSSIESTAWTPQVEAFRRGDRFVVRADLPGLSREDVKVEVQDNVLSISGERRAEHEEDREDYYRSERSYGQFFRAMALPDSVDAEDCEASFRDGVLEVSFAAPPEAERKAKRVPIK